MSRICDEILVFVVERCFSRYLVTIDCDRRNLDNQQLFPSLFTLASVLLDLIPPAATEEIFWNATLKCGTAVLCFSSDKSEVSQFARASPRECEPVHANLKAQELSMRKVHSMYKRDRRLGLHRRVSRQGI